MVVRAGMLVLLAGALPLSASFTNTEAGRMWFQRFVAWMAAFILYKPAAAIIYATAFRLMSSDVFDGDGLMSVLVGVALMVIALVALPALLRFFAPMTATLAGRAARRSAARGRGRHRCRCRPAPCGCPCGGSSQRRNGAGGGRPRAAAGPRRDGRPAAAAAAGLVAAAGAAGAGASKGAGSRRQAAAGAGAGAGACERARSAAAPGVRRRAPAAAAGGRGGAARRQAGGPVGMPRAPPRVRRSARTARSSNARSVAQRREHRSTRRAQVEQR